MEPSTTLSISAIALGGASLGALFNIVSGRRRSARVLSLLTAPVAEPQIRQGPNSTYEASFERTNEAARVALRQTQDAGDDVDIFFRAGIFAEAARKRVSILSKVSLIFCPAIAFGLTYTFSGILPFVATAIGAGVGAQIPRSYLRRASQARDEEIMFYLPLVIEQLVIGVSSSLDIGPCIRWIVQMADERDSHNAVTQLLRYAQQYMKAGASMEDALLLVARLSGHTELKHVFMSLSQVSKHGGEITKQLQELANAVASQREARIEGKIKKLELEATGPVGLVFVAFMATFLSSLALQITTALK